MELWSWSLAAVGIFGLWLAGKKDWRGWAVGAISQVLWVAFAVVTHQYGFILSALAYATVYLINIYRWRFVAPPVAEEPLADTQREREEAP